MSFVRVFPILENIHQNSNRESLLTLYKALLFKRGIYREQSAYPPSDVSSKDGVFS